MDLLWIPQTLAGVALVTIFVVLGGGCLQQLATWQWEREKEEEEVNAGVLKTPLILGVPTDEKSKVVPVESGPLTLQDSFSMKERQS